MDTAKIAEKVLKVHPIWQTEIRAWSTPGNTPPLYWRNTGFGGTVPGYVGRRSGSPRCSGAELGQA